MVWAGCGLLRLHLSPEPGLNQKIDIIIPPNASSVTLSLWMHDLWHQYHSKHIISDVIISPNASSVTSWSLQTHICDLIITLNTSSVISLSLWMHDLWHQYHSKRIIADIIIAPNASSVTSLSLQMHHLWQHYLSEYLICDIIIAPNTSSVTLLLQTHPLWHHDRSECIICDIIVTLNASSVCLISRPPPGFQTADDIQWNVSCAQPTSVVKLSAAQICPSNILTLQCKCTTLRPAQKFPPV